MKLEQRGEVLVLSVKVVPNASRTRVAGVLGEALKVQVAAAPEAGKANRAVEALLAEVLGVPVKNVSVVGGLTQARKQVAITGVEMAEAAARLGAAAGIGKSA